MAPEKTTDSFSITQKTNSVSATTLEKQTQEKEQRLVLTQFNIFKEQNPQLKELKFSDLKKISEGKYVGIAESHDGQKEFIIVGKNSKETYIFPRNDFTILKPFNKDLNTIVKLKNGTLQKFDGKTNSFSNLSKKEIEKINEEERWTKIKDYAASKNIYFDETSNGWGGRLKVDDKEVTQNYNNPILMNGVRLYIEDKTKLFKNGEKEIDKYCVERNYQIWLNIQEIMKKNNVIIYSYTNNTLDSSDYGKISIGYGNRNYTEVYDLNNQIDLTLLIRNANNYYEKSKNLNNTLNTINSINGKYGVGFGKYGIKVEQQGIYHNGQLIYRFSNNLSTISDSVRIIKHKHLNEDVLQVGNLKFGNLYTVNSNAVSFVCIGVNGGPYQVLANLQVNNNQMQHKPGQQPSQINKQNPQYPGQKLPTKK